MLFTKPQDCILQIVDHVGMLSKPQIMMMFSCFDPKSVIYDIRTLSVHAFVIEEKDLIISKTRPRFSPQAQAALLQALWIPANIGAKNVRDIWITDYPSQIIYVTEDDAIYDVTVIPATDFRSTNVLARRMWEAKTPKGEKDIVNHIAIVPTASLVNEVIQAGFDFACMIGSDGVATYFEA